MDVPDDLRYSSDHEWVRIEDGAVRVGITDYAQDALGDVVYVEVPEVGTVVATNAKVSEVESTKSVSDIFAPVAGTVGI
jgi:glycine cleavage system H protein